MIQIAWWVVKLAVIPLFIFYMISGWGVAHNIPTLIAYVMGGAAAFGTINVTARLPI